MLSLFQELQFRNLFLLQNMVNEMHQNWRITVVGYVLKRGSTY